MNEKADSPVHIRLKELFPHSLRIEKLTGDASAREYFRIIAPKKPMVAMVYPAGGAGEEIRRVIGFTELYKKSGLNVPDILDRPAENILIQEDVGDL